MPQKHYIAAGAAILTTTLAVIIAISATNIVDTIEKTCTSDFWGSVIGGVIAGLLTVIAGIITMIPAREQLRYSRAEIAKNRLAFMNEIKEPIFRYCNFVNNIQRNLRVDDPKVLADLVKMLATAQNLDLDKPFFDPRLLIRPEYVYLPEATKILTFVGGNQIAGIRHLDKVVTTTDTRTPRQVVADLLKTAEQAKDALLSEIARLSKIVKAD